MTTSTLIPNLVMLVAGMVALWLISVIVRDASLVDLFWGLGFVAVAWVARPDGWGPPLVLAIMVTAWGLRLSLYLAWRNLGGGEDYRYTEMRRHHGARFWWVSLFTVFLLQGFLIWVVSLPLQSTRGVSSSLPPLAFVGVGVWLVGMVFEAGGDWQLARFRADPRNRGRVMDRGLWRLTRHPNYFGDFLVWWGHYLVAWAAGAPAWTAVGPIVMSILLLRVSGVTLLERSLQERRSGYRAYMQRTPAFFPWFPRAS